jgi:sulfite reductase beta subunit-like hemoprotein
MEKPNRDTNFRAPSHELLSSTEQKKEQLRVVEQLLLHAEKVNEGNNGVIFRLKLEGLDNATRNLIAAELPDLLENEQAIKLLKIYRPGLAEREYNLQQQAYDIVTNSSQEKLARVPTPYGHYDLEVNDGTKNLVDKLGLEKLKDRVEVFFMEFVPGKDLATVLYEEIITRHPAAQKNLIGSRFEDMQAEVIRVLNFSAPGGKGATQEERDFEMTKVMKENAEKIYDFLKKQNFVLHPDIAQQVENTIKEFRKNEFELRDCHERNIMIVGNHDAKQGESGQAYIIDYGEARTKKETDQLANEGVSQAYLPDSYILSIVQKLSTSQEAQDRKEFDTFIKEIIRFRDGLKDRDKKWQLINEQAQASAKEKGATAGLELAFNRSMVITEMTKYFLPLLQQLVESGSATKEESATFIASKLSSVSNAAEKNKLTKYYKYLSGK